MSEGDHREEKILIVEDKIQIIPRSILTQRAPAFIKKLQDSKASLQQAWNKSHCSSLMTPLKWDKHPFFEYLSDIYEERKSFYNNLFFVEGVIFEELLWLGSDEKMIIEEHFILYRS